MDEKNNNILNNKITSLKKKTLKLKTMYVDFAIKTSRPKQTK